MWPDGIFRSRAVSCRECDGMLAQSQSTTFTQAMTTDIGNADLAAASKAVPMIFAAHTAAQRGTLGKKSQAASESAPRMFSNFSTTVATRLARYGQHFATLLVQNISSSAVAWLALSRHVDCLPHYQQTHDSQTSRRHGIRGLSETSLWHHAGGFAFQSPSVVRGAHT